MSKLNPYEPSSASAGDRSAFDRIRAAILGPTPFRVAPEQPMRWLVDAFIAFALIISGILIAEFLRDAFGYLGPLAYPTALLASWFPTGMWLYYCNVGHESLRSNCLLLLGLIVFYALYNGVRGLTALPIAVATLVPILLMEWFAGKLIFSILPGSDRRLESAQTTTES